ncbi:RsmB/NOP family class I SAM-dependent RNA methyltransferase [Oceanomicrobium pacificus]|uniref:Methyltransferase domain-containing protein n=1 Tax=Oceanomicrobium pacificus TaxID=2692916 RepID=A0A6B0TYB3_9RHOB|nr:RsmB/NOP family class I SAM-dependent RNA methyltransferase [Oceanomicrobium pacificus]MXU66272.1 methyltransferase domain-containing protein [Oceanomicrobium pacificus]
MTPAARLSAAIALMDDILAGAPAEKVLVRWARQSRFAGSRDRAAIRDIVFDILRRRRSLAWIGGAETGRAMVIAHQRGEGEDLDTLFTGDGYAPDALTDAERAIDPDRLAEAPLDVRLDVPAFLLPELRRSLGDDLEPVLTIMQSRAPVDLRVNPLRGTVSGAKVMLAQEGIGAEEIAAVPGALRVLENPRRVAGSRAYRSGLVELQDASSQQVTRFARPEAGMTVLDYCAGGGGKTLALAALMGGQGRIIAHDGNPRRMKDLPERASRAGAKVELRDTASLEATPPRCDLVLVDAPCSGSGAWRRNPDGKWTLTAKDMEKLLVLQARILDAACAYVKPGGSLTFATCSLMACENRDQVDAFRARHPDFTIEDDLVLTPKDGGDGFYAARMRRG